MCVLVLLHVYLSGCLIGQGRQSVRVGGGARGVLSVSLFLSVFLFYCPFTPCLYLTRTEDFFSPWASSCAAAPYNIYLSHSSSPLYLPHPLSLHPWADRTKRVGLSKLERDRLAPRKGVAEEQKGGWHLRGEASFLLPQQDREKERQVRERQCALFNAEEPFFFAWVSFYSPCFVSPFPVVPSVGTKLNSWGQDFHNSKHCVCLNTGNWRNVDMYLVLMCVWQFGGYKCSLVTPSQVFLSLVCLYVFLCWLYPIGFWPITSLSFLTIFPMFETLWVLSSHTVGQKELLIVPGV